MLQLVMAPLLTWLSVSADESISIDKQEALRRAHDITVVIRATHGRRVKHGSGVLMAPDGQALTARHVIADSDRIIAELGDGQIVPVKVHHVDKEWDLAVIQCLVKKPVSHGYVSGRMPEMFDRDYLMIGNPGGRGKTAQPARLSRTERVTVSWFGTKQALSVIEGPCEPGFSGGGFFDRTTGTLRGIIVAMSTSQRSKGFVVPTSDYLRFVLRQPDLVKHPRHQITLRCANAFGFWAAPVPLKSDKYRQGLYLTAVRPGGPADRLGWQIGDIMVGLERYKTECKDHVVYVLDQVHNKAQETTVILVRHGNTFRSTVTLPSAEEYNAERFADSVYRRLLAYDEYKGTSAGHAAGAAVSKTTESPETSKESKSEKESNEVGASGDRSKQNQ